MRRRLPPRRQEQNRHVSCADLEYKKPLVLTQASFKDTAIKMASNETDTLKNILEDLKKDELQKETSWASRKTALLCEKMDAVFWKCQDKETFTQVFCDCGGPELFVSILKKFEEDGLFGAWESAFIIYNALCNLSEASLGLSTQLGAHGLVKICANNVVKYREKMHLRDVEALVRTSLSILCNMSTAPANRQVFAEEGVAEKLQPFLTGDPFLKSICMITLAYMAEEGQEYSLGQQGTDTTEYLVGILKDALKSPDKRYRGMCDREIVQALGRLAVHDSNKCKIVEVGGLPLLVETLKSESVYTQQAAANTIKTLAFSDDIRQKLVENAECLQILRTLSTSMESSVMEAAKGALWVITQG